MRGIVNWLRVASDDHSMDRRKEAAEYIEELWDWIEQLNAENARLREALEKIDALDVPRPVLTRYRADGEPSKYDRCTHLRAMWKDCPDCISDYASAALAEKEER